MLKKLAIVSLFLLGSLNAVAHEPAQCDDQPVSLRAMMRGMGNEMKVLATGILRDVDLAGNPITDVKPLVKNAKAISAWMVLAQEIVPTKISAIPDEEAQKAATTEYKRIMAEAIINTDELAAMMDVAEAGAPTAEMKAKLGEVLQAQKDGHIEFK